MLDFLTQPIRWVLGQGERDVVRAMRDTRDLEENVLDAVQAIEHATASIEQHVEVIETLATSIDPLRASVDRLSSTLEELVRLLGPLAGAEHEVERVGRFFHRRRHEEAR